MEPDPMVQLPATGPLAAVLAAAVLPGDEDRAVAGDSDSAAGALLNTWM
jgi:hypothetical protein